MAPPIIEDAEVEEETVVENFDSLAHGQTGVFNRQLQRVYPDAFAMSGVETASRDDEYTITGTSILPVMARIVNENEEDVEHLEEQLRQQEEELQQRDEELERIRMERENVAVAQVISHDKEAQDDSSDGGEADLSTQQPNSAMKQFVFHPHWPRMTWIAALATLSVIVGIVLGVVLPTRLKPQVEGSAAITQTSLPTLEPTAAAPSEQVIDNCGRSSSRSDDCMTNN